MTNRKLLYEKFGNTFDPIQRIAFEKKWMVVFNVRNHFSWCPFKKMYVHAELVFPLINTFTKLEEAGLHTEIKTFDGCFNPRYIRGYEKQKIESLHTWGLPVDLNASDNPLGMSREQCIKKGLIPFTEAFLDIWRQTGWVCGADFGRKDGMHFQWTRGYEV